MSENAQPAPAAAAPDPSTAAGKAALREQVLEALKGNVGVEMTLTSMGCPVQDLIQADAELAVMKVDGVNSVTVDFVWSPPWSPQKMTEDGKKQMRMFGFNV